MIMRAALKAGAAAAVLAMMVAGCSVPVRDNSVAAPGPTVEQVAIVPAAIEEAAPVTVTVTAKPKTVEVTETKTVSEVPQACLDALDEADDLRDISVDMATAGGVFMQHLQDYFDSASLYFQDADALIEGTQTYTATIKGLTDRVQGNDYGTLSTACRSGS